MILHQLSKTLLAPLLLALAAGSSQAASLRDCDIGAYEALRDEAIYPLFNALQAGDIDGIRPHLSATMAGEYERLFTQNPDYGQYLRNYYADSSFELIDVVERGNGYSALVRIYWADGRSVDAELDLGGSLPELAAPVTARCR